MAITSLVIPVLLGIFGAFVLSYLVWLLIGPTVRSLRGRKDSQRFRRAAERVVEADSCIAEKRFTDALRILKQAPLFDLFEKLQLVELVREHHQNILSRCVLIAEELHTRPANLADVERLMMERSELQLLFVRAMDSYSSLKNRRQKAGKEMPLWSRSDFEQRIKEIRSELHKNKELLGAALSKLFASIESARSDGDIVYH